MKKNSAIAIAAVLLSFSACNKKEDVHPSSAGPSSSTAAQAADDVPQAAKPAAKDPGIVTPITGAIDGVPFSGNFRITKFIQKGGQIFAVGHLTDLTGITSSKPIATVLQNKPLNIPVSFPASTPGILQAADCSILDLVLGPLHLDLLGLVIDLNQVVLTITGTTGAGDLLGNLLCAITGLLNPLGDLASLVGLLNDLIDLLNSL